MLRFDVVVGQFLPVMVALMIWFVWSRANLLWEACLAFAVAYLVAENLKTHRKLAGELSPDGKTSLMPWYAGSAVWQWVVATIWGGFVCLGVIGTAEWPQLTTRKFLALAAVAAVLAVTQYAARLQARGWVIDERGERQKVNYWLGDTAIYTPTTRSQRVVDEGVTRQERRRNLFVGAAAFAASAAATWWIWIYHQHDMLVLLFIPAIGGLVYGAGMLVGQSTLELLYLTGFQHMKGAKVRDPEPPKPGLDEVRQQKAHGDAHLASEDEALALLDEMG
ncbi:MAG TPA: hypothetical protein VGC79_20360 [Polyangiaceae bacterium]